MRHALVWALLALQGVSSMSSKKCVNTLRDLLNRGEDPHCKYHICGALAPASDLDAGARLSTQCLDTLERYRNPGVTAQEVPVHRPPQCDGLYSLPAQTAIQNAHTPNFILCSSPKAGVTQFRTLLFLLSNIDSETPFESVTTLGERSAELGIHRETFPGAELFHIPASSAASHLSFAIGRNPYTRLLSGYLDKMVWHSEYMEFHTLQRVNSQLGMPQQHLWGDSAESFALFARMLANALRAGRVINEHFRPQAQFCSMPSFPYTYRMRLEDMHEWYPCWSALLGLERFTDRGWPPPTSDHPGWFNTAEPECWWRPRGTTCEQYAAQRTDHAGLAVPITDRGGGASSMEGHNLNAAAKLRRYYLPATEAIVYDAYRADFDLFGYPRELP